MGSYEPGDQQYIFLVLSIVWMILVSATVLFSIREGYRFVRRWWRRRRRSLS